MRFPRYLSPSALSKYEKDKELFFVERMSDDSPGREAQQAAASVGSAFDSRVKERLGKDLFGDDRLNYDALFTRSVEEQNRDAAGPAGDYVFDNYVASGAYAELRDMMEGATNEPRFEFDAEKVVGDVPLMGKPDCAFTARQGCNVVLDFKVNGFYSKSATSPEKGYKVCWAGLDWPTPPRGDGGSHNLYKPTDYLGMEINGISLENYSIDWADQLATYSWFTGTEPGDESTLFGIHQIVCKPRGEGQYPLIRVARHLSKISAAYQKALVSRYQSAWKQITSGVLFPELGVEGNTARLESLASRARAMQSDGSDEGDYFARLARGNTQYRSR